MQKNKNLTIKTDVRCCRLCCRYHRRACPRACCTRTSGGDDGHRLRCYR